MMFSIILGAGKSERFGEKKIYKTIKGIKVIEFSIVKFLKFGADKIIIAINKSDTKEAERIVSEYGKDKIFLVHGGETRWESFEKSFSKLCEIIKRPEEDDIIIEHDAARPLFSIQLLEDITKKINEDKKIKGVIPFITPVETVRTITNLGSSEIEFLSEIPRNQVALIQTPQVFRFKVIRNLIEKNKEKFTDLGGLLFKNKIRIVGVYGERRNIKITFKEDLEIAEKLISDEEIKIVEEMKYDGGK